MTTTPPEETEPWDEPERALTDGELAGVNGSFERLGRKILDTPEAVETYERHLAAIHARHQVLVGAPLVDEDRE